MNQLPLDLPAKTSKQLMLRSEGHYDYTHGDIRTRRFYFEDGAGRKHPLRARWRLRLETVLYRWVLNVCSRLTIPSETTTRNRWEVGR